MKDNDAPTVISVLSPTTVASSTSPISIRKDSSNVGFSGKTRYKFWVLAAILLLAFWSMFTGSVTLEWSAGKLTHPSEDLGFATLDDDLDILEIEEKEKLVKHMWDIYTHSTSTKLPHFWQEAFEAAYESLASDVPSVRDAAISEIAKMFLRSFNPDPLPVQSIPNSNQGKKSPMVAEESKRPSQ
ncbi:uncharacterized protein LOC8288909 [Ricinus communis]|uniref:Uncharacterized protein n=1 Tax=Ricinus communis TaxID=3988 RepID=B9R7S5_RICCO|nr:uncharacterized protein LOC8288909 [Ricinus communis]EEF52555.1 conserved hypothetical protein [Ricinus communis]|eukprot:XP_002510368.1 uncharacterized protein LOC8288909 [Ricinus communis]